MGVLNVTPDSFSDGGRYLDPTAAVTRLHAIAAEGAAICDVGAESTRPGSDPVPVEEELRRLEPVLAVVAGGGPLPISIDTSKAAVAAVAMDAGAVLVNDVTAGRGDPDLLPLVGERDGAVCLMHMRGEPRTMQEAPRYDDVVGEVRGFLEERLEAAVAAGISEQCVLLDPGIGFGKRLQDNLALIAGLQALTALGRPVVVGVSRKSMFLTLLGREVEERLAPSLAAGLAAVARGAAVLRAHDVQETVDALATWTAVEAAAR
ncbi:MAG TPA: dihydropteroate synthase [Miltoncostaeaceae bacterium]|nr:dihydropteroate synthase [Miltoncostaeaceae bacterium]